MKKIICLLNLLLFNSVIFFSFAQQIITVNISSNELGHHVFDSLSHKSIGVYLPPSHANSKTKFPVLYFLTGYGCNYFDKQTMINHYNNEVTNGTFKEMIIVFIDGCTANSNGCFYLNSIATGNWENFIISNVVPYIDSNYRTIANSESRAIAGHSMGGFGALSLAMLHPDVFGSVYNHSPGLFSNTGLEDCQMFKNNSNIDAFIKLEEELSVLSKEEAHKEYLKRLSGLGPDLRFTIEYGMAVAPNLNKNAPYVDFPYSKINDALIKNDTLWEKWEFGFGGFDSKIPYYKNNFQTLDTIVIDYGTNDYFQWIPEGCRYVSSILSSNEIKNSLIAYSGGHSNLNRYSTKMFPMLMKSLVFDTINENSTTINQLHSDKTMVKIKYKPHCSNITIGLPDSLKESYGYKIIDINGRALKHGVFRKTKNINTSNITNGCYFIIVLSKMRVYTSKILIN